MEVSSIQKIVVVVVKIVCSSGHVVAVRVFVRKFGNCVCCCPNLCEGGVEFDLRTGCACGCMTVCYERGLCICESGHDNCKFCSLC